MPTAIDQASLISAVLDGGFETPPWATLLDLLKNATGADFVTLIFRPPGRPLSEALHLYSGPIPAEQVHRTYGRYHASLEFLTDLQMEEGRLYEYEELYPPRNAAHLPFYHDVIVPSGVNVCHMMRVMEPTGVSAWLTVSRAGRRLDGQSAAVMKMIAPVLRGALRSFVALEREKFAAAVAGNAMQRLHFAWIALDADGYVVEHDVEAGRVFALSGILAKGPGNRLEIYSQRLKDGILKAIRELADRRSGARAFTLSHDPWLDMLLVPASSNGMSANPRAAVIAYIHGDSWHASDRCEQLTQLFGLSPSEARLAFALSRGMTITEAAESLGIKIETARKCTKLIYAKIGAGGLPDLIRIVMRSVLAMVPAG